LGELQLGHKCHPVGDGVLAREGKGIIQSGEQDIADRVLKKNREEKREFLAVAGRDTGLSGVFSEVKPFQKRKGRVSSHLRHAVEGKGKMQRATTQSAFRKNEVSGGLCRRGLTGRSESWWTESVYLSIKGAVRACVPGKGGLLAGFNATRGERRNLTFKGRLNAQGMAARRGGIGRRSETGRCPVGGRRFVESLEVFLNLSWGEGDTLESDSKQPNWCWLRSREKKKKGIGEGSVFVFENCVVLALALDDP